SAANPPACRTPFTGPPTQGFASRCDRGSARSMSRWPAPWPWARRCGRPAGCVYDEWMTTSPTDAAILDQRKTTSRAWFERLRNDICMALEAAEDALPREAPHAERAPGRFERKPWQRSDHTG